MSYPYPIREVVADGVIHALGISAAVTGVWFLVVQVARADAAPGLVAIGVYACFLLVALLASAAYHMLPWDQSRPWLHKIDHAAIYLKIAGTYTPFVVLIGSAFAYAVLAIVWIIALGAAIAKLSFWETDSKASLPLYLALGWAALLLMPPMVETLPAISLFLFVSGGLLYTVGTIFFSWQGLPFQNAIWHSFVLAASTCIFISIALTVGSENI